MIRPFLVKFGFVLALVLWSYWSTLGRAAERWSTDPQYSHGYLVPLFALYLLYQRRSILQEGVLAPSALFVIPLLFAVVLRVGEAKYFYNGLDQFSLTPMLLAAALATGGKVAFKWSWPASCFLLFMVPLPYRLQTALSTQLQGVATQFSHYVLVSLGVPAVAEGNIILVEEVRIGVVEACSGLGMGVTFMALAAAFVMLSRSKMWIRIALVLLALPTAIVANVIRIVATAILYHWEQAATARAVFHDLAGWLMIPLGCALLMLELWILENLFIQKPTKQSSAPLPMRKQK